ncbi:hypothetical protein TrispH2_003209 [Trichoplax sp. H2]|nr:hypothetical protein TrispH2_003209 [Trichoplax sp. H2]|eukprot:RDD45004.1 hypothetical protein TrispH2_003209 [Trichoplax sp. H2]
MPSTTHKQFDSLWNELFPTTLGNGTDNTKVVTTYLYVLPDGFFVLLSASKGLPFYDGRMGSVDSSGVNKIQEGMCGTLALSSTALDSLKRKAKVVDVYKKNASKWCFDRQEEWELDGIPPFICFAGKWNEERNLLGTTTVDWETLITEKQPLHHPFFVLERLSATWNESSTSPNFRGFRFDHPDCQFKIWVHEKNPRALQSALNDLEKQIKEFNKILDFCKKFESAAFTFLSTQSFPTTHEGDIDWEALKGWGSLAREIPFPHLKSRYSDVFELLRSYEQNQTEDRRQALEAAFKKFFQNLPYEAHFPTENVMAETFRKAFSAFDSAGENNYGDSSTVQECLTMLKCKHRYLGIYNQCNVLDQLIKLCQQYSDRQLPDNLPQLNDFQKEYTSWLMGTNGKFADDLRDEIKSREKRYTELRHFKDTPEEGTDSPNSIAERTKPPRSYVESTVQIAYYSDLEPHHLHAIIRRNRGYQLSALQSKISSVFNSFRDDTLLNEFCDRLKRVCSNTIQFMVRKATYFESSNPSLNALNGNRGEDAFNGNKGKDAFNHLKKVLDVLSKLHTSVLQNKEVKLSCLSEERKVVTELYTVTCEFLFLLQVPLSWNLHRQLHEHSDQTEKAERRLAEGGNCRLYKRMSNGGLVLWDIVPNDKTSELEKCNSVHTAIYHQRH